MWLTYKFGIKGHYRCLKTVKTVVSTSSHDWKLATAHKLIRRPQLVATLTSFLNYFSRYSKHRNISKKLTVRHYDSHCSSTFQYSSSVMVKWTELNISNMSTLHYHATAPLPALSSILSTERGTTDSTLLQVFLRLQASFKSFLF